MWQTPEGAEVRHGILSFIENFLKRRGYPPSLAEMGEAVGKSKSTVFYHLQRLEVEGRIERCPYVARGIRLVGVGGT